MARTPPTTASDSRSATKNRIIASLFRQTLAIDFLVRRFGAIARATRGVQTESNCASLGTQSPVRQAQRFGVRQPVERINPSRNLHDCGHPPRANHDTPRCRGGGPKVLLR